MEAFLLMTKRKENYTFLLEMGLWLAGKTSPTNQRLGCKKLIRNYYCIKHYELLSSAGIILWLRLALHGYNEHIGGLVLIYM